MIPKVRLDALTDGVFAFAMTVLVLDLRLPDDFAPQTGAELSAALLGQSEHFFVYALSFAVLGIRWLGQAGFRSESEAVSAAQGGWALLYLFFIVSMPFSTMVVGRYGNLPPAVWLYAGNMIASSLVGWQLAAVEGEDRSAGTRSRQVGTLVLLASALLSVALSLIAPRWAMYAYLLNLLVPLARLVRPKPPV